MHGVSGIHGALGMFMNSRDGRKDYIGLQPEKDQNYLEKVPVRNPEFSVERGPAGNRDRGMVHKGNSLISWPRSWITPGWSHVKLDRFGSFVWKQMDGNRNIIAIGAALVREGIRRSRPSRCMNGWPSL